MFSFQMDFFKSVLVFVTALMIVAGASGVLAEEKTTITFINPLSPTGGWAMFWSCQDRFWPEEGVYGEVIDSKGSGDVLKAVSTGSANMGYAAVSAIMQGIQEGMPVRIVLIGAQNDTTALLTIKNKGIENLKDFEGKTIGVFPAGITTPLVKIMLKKNNVDLSSIKFVNVNPGNAPQLLMVGKIDAMTAMAGVQDVQLASNGYDPLVFAIKDYGFSMYAFAVIISTNWEKKVSRETVLKYVRGIVKGFILSKTDVKKMIDDMVKYRPEQRAFYEARLAESYPRWNYTYKSEIVDKYGFGWIDKSRMEETQNVLFESGYLSKKIDAEKYYTKEYITDKTISSSAMEYAKAKLDPNLETYYDKVIPKK